MGRPQIKQEDYLIPEELLEGSLEGEWVRVSAYDQGHRVSSVGHTAYCGVPLVYDEQWWERFQAWLTDWSGYKNRAKGTGKWSPTPYYLARDRRPKAQCPTCKGEDLPAKADEGNQSSPSREVSLIREDYRPFVDPTPADRLQHQRFLTKVAWVARELDATVVSAEEAEAA